MLISLAWTIIMNECVCDLYGQYSLKRLFQLENQLSCFNDSRKAVKRPSANMAPVSCHLPVREHMARDTLVWWKQTQPCQSTSDQQAKAQALIKTLSHKAENGKIVMWWQMCILQTCWKSFILCFSANTLLKIKGFSQWCQGKTCLVPQRIFHWKHSKKNHFSCYKEHFHNLKNLFSNRKKTLVEWKVSMDDKSSWWNFISLQSDLRWFPVFWRALV